jgi:hypothetical protein
MEIISVTTDCQNKRVMNKDVTIIYQGGSGGFCLFYYLLLSGHYQTGISELTTRSVTDLIAEQFSHQIVDNPRVWKTKEFWPDNGFCQNNLVGPRLYLICNPVFNPGMLNQNLQISENTHKILLYTSLDCQLRMAYEKRAYWFTDVSKREFDAPVNEQQYLKKIKKSGVRWNNVMVDPMTPRIEQVFRPNQVVRLENFVTTHHLTNFSQPNKLQIAFLDFWLHQQPKKCLKYFEHIDH